MKNKKPKILICYDYFPPASKSGGITRSLTYLIQSFSDEFDFYVICSAYDLGEQQPMSDIQLDQWQDYKAQASVMYVDSLSIRKFNHILQDLSPDSVYINGIFSPRFSLYPLLLARYFRHCRFVLAPRGMLQSGALRVKALKKRLFLLLFKLTGLHKRLIWHATDLQEKKDIAQLMGKNAKIIFAEDTPDLNDYRTKRIKKNERELKLVFISLLTAKKNLRYLLEVLTGFDHEVSLDIYGPIKDQAYWEECQALLRKMPEHIHIQYKGAIHPDDVLDTLAVYHFFILPTLGENFGHAIYESFNVGRPVIISDRTPWQDLQPQEAGWDFSLEDENALEAILIKCVSMDQNTYDAYCQGAKALARKYVAEAGFEEKYKRLFGTKA